MPTQLTITPGEYLVNVDCPCDGYGALPPEPPIMVRTLAIPEDGNFPYQPPPLPPATPPIGSSGDGVGFFPSTFFQYPVYPGSGASIGSPPAMPGGWRPPNYGISAPKPMPAQPPFRGIELAPGVMRYETPPGYVPLAPGIDTPEEWIMGFGTSQWDRYNLTAGKPGEIDTTEDWIYGYDRDAINDPRTNFSLSQSLEKLPFGVFSWDRNPLVTQ